MATAAQKHRKARKRKAHQRQCLERNAAQGHTGGPDTTKRSIHPVAIKVKVTVTNENDEIVVGRCPTQAEFDSMVAEAKRKKRGFLKYAQSKGWVLMGADLKVKDHWEIADA